MIYIGLPFSNVMSIDRSSRLNQVLAYKWNGHKHHNIVISQ